MNDRYIGAGSGYPRYIGHLPLTSNRGIHPHTPRYGLSAVVTSICSIYLFFSRIHTSQVTQQHLLSYVTVACLHTYISLVISFLDASIYLTQFWLQAKRKKCWRKCSTFWAARGISTGEPGARSSRISEPRSGGLQHERL